VGALHGGCDGPGEGSLACSGGVLEEQVPFGQHACQCQPDHVGFAQDGLTDVVCDARKRVSKPRGVFWGDCHLVIAYSFSVTPADS